MVGTAAKPGRISTFWYIARTVLGLLFSRPLVGVRAIPRLPDGRLVLVKQHRGGWVLPGGLIDTNEKVQTALVREVLEECGLRVLGFGRLTGVYSDPKRDPRFHSLCIVMEVFVEGEMRPRDVMEIERAAAFALEALPEGLTGDCREQIEHYLAGAVVVD
ncbi:NUDIX domain-containing protein [Gloeobacter morelensis]|uniref:NUDIX domain-containing protein n=1 Tax=Gloeobacter morelensis TaxID=2907343 RepID=UPI001E354EE7|nr:NUDIX hydrolase [Gloeobacter morelensis]